MEHFAPNEGLDAANMEQLSQNLPNFSVFGVSVFKVEIHSLAHFDQVINVVHMHNSENPVVVSSGRGE